VVDDDDWRVRGQRGDGMAPLPSLEALDVDGLLFLSFRARRPFRYRFRLLEKELHLLRRGDVRFRPLEPEQLVELGDDPLVGFDDLHLADDGPLVPLDGLFLLLDGFLLVRDGLLLAFDDGVFPDVLGMCLNEELHEPLPRHATDSIHAQILVRHANMIA
jgi:hypothetical protein